MPSKMRAERLGILWCFRESLAQHIFNRAGRQLSTFEGMRDAFSCKRVTKAAASPTTRVLRSTISSGTNPRRTAAPVSGEHGRIGPN